MQTHEAETLTYSLLRKHNLFGWAVRISNMKKTLGLCSFRDREITLSRLYVIASETDKVEQTILHEIAHALTGRGVKAHGREWKRVARSIGVQNPKATTSINDTHRQMIDATKRGPNYAIDCPNCGRISTAQRMGKRMRFGTYRCRKCGVSGLRWTTV